jgi:HEAT repeat protein
MDDFNQIYGRLRSEEDKKYLELKAKNDVDGLIALLSMCRDNKDKLGRQIIDTLGGRRVVQAVDTLISILNDVNDHLFRHDAARALAQICDRRAVEPLISALGDDDGRLRIVAAEALGDIRDTRAVEPLIAKLDDDFAIYRNDTAYDTIDTTVHRTAAASLQKITSQNFGKDATAWQQWWAQTQSKKRGCGCKTFLAGISILIGVLLSIVWNL